MRSWFDNAGSPVGIAADRLRGQGASDDALEDFALAVIQRARASGSPDGFATPEEASLARRCRQFHHDVRRVDFCVNPACPSPVDRDPLLEAWGASRGLDLREAGRVAVGTLDGVFVEVSVRGTEPAVSTRLSAHLAQPLPHGTVVGRPRNGEPGVHIGDLILDGRLDIRTSDLGALASRLQREVVRAPLLELVLEERAWVSRDRVQVEVPGALDGDALDRWVARLAELARGLG